MLTSELGQVIVFGPHVCVLSTIFTTFFVERIFWWWLIEVLGDDARALASAFVWHFRFIDFSFVSARGWQRELGHSIILSIASMNYIEVILFLWSLWSLTRVYRQPLRRKLTLPWWKALLLQILIHLLYTTECLLLIHNQVLNWWLWTPRFLTCLISLLHHLLGVTHSRVEFISWWGAAEHLFVSFWRICSQIKLFDLFQFQFDWSLRVWALLFLIKCSTLFAYIRIHIISQIGDLLINLPWFCSVMSTLIVFKLKWISVHLFMYLYCIHSLCPSMLWFSDW